MKAVRIHEWGGPEVLRYEDAPEPVIGPADALVRVRACALNHLDLWVRAGLNPDRPLPRILGCDIAGEVAAVGDRVTWARPGDPVMVIPNLSCGRCPACLSGHDNNCRQYGIIGSSSNGGYAEYVQTPAVNLVPKPAHLSWEEAAAIPLVYLTAWHMLVTDARVSPGDWVLVMGGGSGVGSAAIQIARVHGARVIATAGSPKKLTRCQELGAEFVIDHSQEDILATVRRITAKRGVDIVFEHVGDAVWEAAYKSLTAGGRLVTCGATTGYTVSTDLRYVFSRALHIAGAHMGSRGEFLQFMPLVRQGRLRGVVDRVLPLQEARAAHELLEQRQAFGKVVLVP